MTTACPKAMVHGPCGGVRDDGGCEVAPLPCAFVSRWTDPPGEFVHPPATGPVGARAPLTAAASELLALAARRPLVVAELPARALDAAALTASAQAVAGHLDAVLLGDEPRARVQLPPTLRADLVARAGVRAWAGLTCRDRSRVALESELAGLAAVGAAAVHCVTGDHPALGHRADAPGVFDLDGPQLAALASASGLVVSVPESPAAPPTSDRPARLARKAGAGAHVGFVNFCGGPERVGAFADAARALVPGLILIACVPLAVSAAALERVLAFTRGGVSAATVDALDAPDPVGAAVRAAVQTAEELLALPGVAGVDLSAPAAPGEELRTAAALALAGAALGGGA